MKKKYKFKECGFIMSLINKSKFTMEEMKRVINILSVHSEQNVNDMDSIITDCIPIICEELNLSKMSDEEKNEFKVEALIKINEIIESYRKYQKLRIDNDKLVITYNDKDYFSRYINLELYYEIQEKLRSDDLKNLSDYTIFKLFDGILSSDRLMEIKSENPLYWEIITDDCELLIVKTINSIISIKQYRLPMEMKKSEESEVIDPRVSSYSSLLESYQLLPEEINKNKAVDMFNSLALIGKRQIKESIERHVDEFSRNFGVKGIELEGKKYKLMIEAGFYENENIT